ncbi:MAG: DUF1800 domain-containing protein [Gemmatimonadota bacterium]|nr:DUF1800 domain-containing protein [Gemmatimonadota bacterium]
MRPPLCLLALALPLVSPASAQAPLSARDSAFHVLNRLAWGPAPGQVDAVLREGALAWAERQLGVARVDDPKLATRLPERFPVLALRQADFIQLFVAQQQQQQAAARAQPDDPMRPQPGVPPAPGTRPANRNELRDLGSQTQQLVLARATASEHQAAEVLVDFWFNHFNVFYGKGLVRPYLHSYVEEAIRPNALGKFEDLLIATARHPAMLFYLDNAQSVADGAVPPNLQRLQQAQRQARRPGQAARTDSMMRRAQQRMPTGINENYARELLELHTLGVDGGYTQGDIEEIARILTGWGIARPGQGAGFVYSAWAHDRGAKTVLGMTFPAGGGEDEGVRLLQALASHPATMHNVSAKLCGRLVADAAPDGCIDDAVSAWRRTGGEIREVVRAIVHSQDFWAAANVGSKVKTPLEFVLSAVRAVGGTVDDTPRLSAAVTRLGQPTYLKTEPTGYQETQEDWVNSGALLNRMNLAMALAAGLLPGVSVNLEAVIPRTADRDALLDAIDARLFGGKLSRNTRSAIAAELADIRDPQTMRAMALGLALGGPEFQRQ